MATEELWGNICLRSDCCALTGAAAFFAGIPGACIIANAPNWCYFYALRHIERNTPGFGKRFFGTQLDNNNIIYGSKENLVNTITRVREYVPNCSCMLVQNSCAAGLIGDDISGISAQAAGDIPIVCIDSGGLKGGFNEGYQLAALKYLQNLKFKKSPHIRPKSVNLIGLSPSCYNGYNDLQELQYLLNMAGYNIIASIGAGATDEQLHQIPIAELNIVLHPELGLEIAKMLQAECGTPFVAPPLPYGLDGTRQWLESIHTACWGNLPAVTQAIDNCRTEVFAATNELRSIWGELRFDKALLAAQTSTALSLGRALQQECAYINQLTLALYTPAVQDTTDSTMRILNLPYEEPELREELLNMQNGLVFGSGVEKSFLGRHKIEQVAFVNIAQPVYDELLLTREPFMGLNGYKHLLQKLWNKKIDLQYLSCEDSWIEDRG